MRVSLTFLTVNVFLAVRFFIHKNNVESKDNPTVLFSLFFGSDEKKKRIYSDTHPICIIIENKAAVNL